MSHTGNYDIESQVGHHLHHQAGGSLKSNLSMGRAGYLLSPLILRVFFSCSEEEESKRERERESS